MCSFVRVNAQHMTVQTVSVCELFLTYRARITSRTAVSRQMIVVV